MRIPITMCHGTAVERDVPLDGERFENYFRIAAEMGFETITYDDLAGWRAGEGGLPKQPIMFDFDHPMKSIRHEICPIMERFGFVGNLFVDTGRMEALYANPLPELDAREILTWEEIGEMLEAGWLLGAHTHSHPNLSELSEKDPDGRRFRQELETCNEILESHLGVTPKDFAFTGTSWSSVAEREVKQRYRFGRLWIVGSMYEADGNPTRYADLVGAVGPDEADGGPPCGARYITRETDAYRLPSMELLRLIFEYDAFRRYLEGALDC